MHILCPHCHNPIELVKIDPRQEISCPSCGSSFHLEGGTTTGWERSAGETLGKFEMLDVVGQGAFGTVYKARDPELDRVVAIKVPRSGNLAGQKELDRFLREARSVARLRHPSIVSIHEVGQQDGVPYLVSDFVQGVTLADLLSARRPGFRESAELIAAVADALQYAHTQGIIHRDVKPSNVMLGEGGAVFVMDFGLAKRDAGEITMTVEGQVLGTPAYMPPEQARGEAHAVDARGDVYSLGVVLYQLLTGELPFRGTQRMLLHQVLHDEPRRPRSLNEHIPRDLETICLKAMAKEPGRRYTTAGELADELRRWLAGEPIQARPAGRAERAARWVRRHPAPAALAAVSGLAVLAVVALGVGLAYHTRLAAAYDAEEEQRKEAEAARDLAESARQGEAKQRKEAEAARDLAEVAKQGEAKERQRAEEIGYFHSIFLADLALKEDNLPLAQRRLQESKAGLRNWEWRYLSAQCQPELFSFPGKNPTFSPDGAWVAAGGQDQVMRVYNTRTGHEAFTLKRSSGFKFSPDGTRVAALGQDRVVRLYDTRTGRETFTLEGPANFEFSPDGTRIAGTPGLQKGGAVQVYDVRTGQKAFALKGLTRFDVARFSPDGSRLAVAGDGVVWVYDVRTGQEIFTCKESSRFLVFSPDGARLAATSYPGGGVRLYDTGTGQETFAVKAPAKTSPGVTLSMVAFSPDGSRFAIGSSAGFGEVRVYDTRTGQEVFPLKGAGYARMVFSADGTRITLIRPTVDSTGSIEEVRVYDAHTGQEAFTLKGASYPRGFMLSPGETRLTGWVDGATRVYDAHTGREVAVLKESSGIWGPVFSPDGTRLAASGGAGVRVYDAHTGQEVFALKGSATVGQPVFSPDGTRLATSDGTWTVRVFDAQSRPEAFSFKLPDYNGSVVYSPDRTRIAFGGNGKEGRVYDVRTGREVFTLKGSDGPPVFNPDGTRLAARSGGGAVRLYDARTGQEGITIQGPARLFVLALSPDGTRLAATCGDGAVRLYDTRTGRELFTLLKGPVGYREIVFSPDGTRLAVGANNIGKDSGGARVYDAHTGQEVFTLQNLGGSAKFVFSPDGTRTAAGFGLIRLFDARTGQEVHTFKGPIFTEEAVYSPDGSRIALAGPDAVRVCDARTGQELFTLKAAVLLRSPVFSPDGSRLAAESRQSGDGAVRVYDARTGQETFTLKAPVLLRNPVFSPDGSRLAAWGVLNPLNNAKPVGLWVWTAPSDQEAWQADRRKIFADRVPTWHRAQAVQRERAEEWFAAAFHWGQLTRSEPSAGRPHFGLGLALTHLGKAVEAKGAFAKALASKEGLGDLEQATAHAELGQWDAARTLYARAVESPQASYPEMIALVEQARQRLRRGDRTGYSVVCTALVNRFGKTTNSFIANDVAWACALGPEALPDLKPAVELARLAVRTQPKNAGVRNTFGAILYRDGQYREAVSELNESLKLRSQVPQIDSLFLAMAHHMLDQLDEARTCLDKGLRVNPSDKALTDGVRLELQLLRREAETLIRGPAPAEKK